MTTVTRTFTVDPSPEVVVAYLKDFGHAEQWDPGTESCRRTDAGPIDVGATWHNTSRIAGVTTELTYTLKKLTNDTLVFAGSNDTANTTDTITVRPAQASSGSVITYHADIEMKGAAKLATPAIKIVFEKLGNDTARQMTDVLNAL